MTAEHDTPASNKEATTEHRIDTDNRWILSDDGHAHVETERASAAIGEILVAGDDGRGDGFETPVGEGE